MGILEAYDLGILYWFGSLHRPWLDSLVRAWTHLGDFVLLGSLTTLVFVFFLATRRYRLAGVLALVGLSSLVVEWGVKLLVQRPRPNVSWRLIDLPNEPSFPSGHSLCSMALYPTMAFLIGGLSRSRRAANLLLAAGFLVALSIGLTRPYLGVHYPMDVLAGWTAGLAIVLLTLGLTGPRAEGATA